MRGYTVYIRYARIIRALSTIAFCLLTIILFFTICPIKSRLTDTTATPIPDTSTTITVTSTNTSASIDLMPTDANGTFASSPAASSIAFNVSTNNLTGYELSIASISDDKLHSANGNYTLDSITSSISEATFASATNTTYNGKWGYKPNKYNSESNTNYLPAPTTTTTTLDKTNEANSTANSYTIAIGARVDGTKPASTYTNTFVLTAVGNPILYEINYLDNTGDSSVADLPAQEANDTSPAIGVTLSSTVPTRTGYTFAGWCDGTVTHVTTGGDSSCSGTTYAPGGSYIFANLSANTNIANLYAMWNANSYTCTKRYRLQTATNSWGSYTTESTEQVKFGATCSYSTSRTDYKASSTGTNNGTASTSGVMNSTSGITLSLNLYRNTYGLTVDYNSTYINSASSTTSAVHTTSGVKYYRWGQSVSITATPKEWNSFSTWSQTAGTSSTFGDTTLASTTFTMPKSAATVYATGVRTYSMQNFTSATCQEVASTSSVVAYDLRDDKDYRVRYINGNCWMVQNLRFAGSSINSTTTNINTSKSISWQDLTKGDNTTTVAQRHNSGNDIQGYWYNFAGASAMTITGESNSTNATYDLCPKNWKLPTKTLANAMISYKTAWFDNGEPVTGGYWRSGTNGSTGRAYWWTATKSTDEDHPERDRYLLDYNINDDGLLSIGSHDRDSGRYIRCVRTT